MNEQTFVMIKPDGVRKGLIDEIVARIKRTGLKITSMRRMKLDRELADKLYSVHKEKPFFEGLVNHVLSGEVVVIVVEGEQVISTIRELNGATDPAKASKGTIRGDFASSITENIVHASDSLESANREISIFFRNRCFT
ncbi:MAG: nucleoside-diphosphate kinase [Methanobacteriota archaeon]